MGREVGAPIETETSGHGELENKQYLGKITIRVLKNSMKKCDWLHLCWSEKENRMVYTVGKIYLTEMWTDTMFYGHVEKTQTWIVHRWEVTLVMIYGAVSILHSTPITTTNI